MNSLTTYFSPPQSFHRFYESWMREQEALLNELDSAIHNEAQRNQTNMCALRGRAMDHYQQYYAIKRDWCRRNARSLLSPSWTSSFEDGLLWVGGWRPTMAFHLLHSLLGLEYDGRYTAIFQGIRPVSVGNLTQFQRGVLQEKLNKAMDEELLVTNQMAQRQVGGVGRSAVGAAQTTREARTQDERRAGEERFESVMLATEASMVDVIERADRLRFRALEDVVVVLEPIQAVNYLIAAADLHLKIHNYGKKRDDPETELGNRDYSSVTNA